LDGGVDNQSRARTSFLPAQAARHAYQANTSLHFIASCYLTKTKILRLAGRINGRMTAFIQLPDTDSVPAFLVFSDLYF
jgi:hypothetical protein